MSKRKAVEQPRLADLGRDDNDLWCWCLIGTIALGSLAAIWVPVLIFS
jgi:hypothetical protein